MSDLLVRGGNKLKGELTPAGNKNAALPALCATLLTNETVTFRNFPDLIDVNKLVDLLSSMGSEIEWDKQNSVIKINNSQFKDDFGQQGFPLGMRGAVLLLGPLVARIGEIEVKEEIGGCTLGIRELDPHLEVLKELGAEVTTNGSIKISGHDGLEGGFLWSFPALIYFWLKSSLEKIFFSKDFPGFSLDIPKSPPMYKKFLFVSWYLFSRAVIIVDAAEVCPPEPPPVTTSFILSLFLSSIIR